ncbi:MAG: hypothetical protein IKL44_04605 [Clostridia bacterium]|nr:hypothetical protein [Clostridia bacterium]
MKKILSISLAVVMLVSALSVLMILPAAATGPVNLITNGDGSMGYWSDNGFETAAHGTDDWGMIVAGNPYAWRTAGYNANTMAAYSNADFYWHNTGVFKAGHPNTTGAPSMRVNKWNQTMQDIKIQPGKAYTVTLDATFIPVANTANQTAWFDVAIVNKAGQFVDAVTNKFTAVTGKTYDLCDSGDEVYQSLYVNTATEGYPTFTYGDATYWDFGDFKEYSFTFAADSVIADYALTDADGDGYYDVTLALQNNSGLVLVFDNVTVYEVASIISGEGGYVEGDTDAATGDSFEVTAKPYYGNTFAGWYDEDGLVSTSLTYKGVLSKTLTAKFNVYNQIVDGSFEANNGDAASYFNSKTPVTNSGKNTVVNVPAGSSALHGAKALYAAPATALNTNCDLISMPVTVEKNKRYVMHLSYYSVGTAQAGYIGLHADKSFTNGWTAGTNIPAYTYHWEAEGVTNKAAWTVDGGVTEGTTYTIVRKQTHATVGSGADKWIDLWLVFDVGEETTIFDADSNTASMQILFGLGNSATNTYYIDNVSFCEATATAYDKITVSAGENGSVTAATGSYAPDSVYYADLAGGKSGSAATAVDGSVRYANMHAVSTYTATAENGFVFDGWYDQNDNLVSTNATESFYIEGSYTAKFVEGSICDDGGYIVENGDGTVTAKAYYGNVFLGWYQDDVLKSTNPTSEASLRYVAKFDYNNQIIDGDFTVGDGITVWTENKLSAMNFAAAAGKDDSTGMNAKTYSDAMMSAKYPVTVKKDTTYVMSYNMKINSYEATGTAVPVYCMMVAGSTSGANTWGNWPTLGWYSIVIRSSEDHSKFIKYEKFNSIENYQMRIADIVNACGNGWLDVFVEFNTGSDTTTASDGNMFEDSDTATFYMAMGTNKSKTDIDYDNISFGEKKTVPYEGKENVRVDALGVQPVTNGLEYSFKLLHADDVELTSVKYGGQDITAVNGVYTVTLAEGAAISVTASNDADYPEKGKDFDGNSLDAWDIPLYNIPVWEGNTVYQENVLFYPGRDGAKLLYPIDEVISVRSYDLETYYVKGVDFDILDGKFVLLEGTSIPVFRTKPLLTEEDEEYSSSSSKTSDTEGVKVARYWEYDTCNYALSITYTHSKVWEDGYQKTAQNSLTSQLTSVMNKLENGEDVHVVFYGDSMTSGMSASGGLYQVYDTTNSGTTIPYGWWLPPFTPNWMTLFIEGLKDIYPDANITWENLSLGGQTADWGAKNIEARYKLLDKEPDLFLIGYGINDDGKGTVTKDAFKASTAQIIDFIKATKSDTSILLYGGNAVNDAISVYEQATEKLFADALMELGEEYDDVAATSLTDIYLDIAKSKEPADYMADLGVHANDFGCRIYAQTMLSAMTPAPSVPGEFEPGSNVSDVVTAGTGVTAVTDSYTAEDKLVNGYDEATMGDGYLKVTANPNTAYLDVGFPVELVKGNKYLAHFKLRVLSTTGEARFDVRMDTAAASWAGIPEGLTGKTYASFAYGKVFAGKGEDAALFGNWETQGYSAQGYVDFYMVIDATNVETQTAYVNVGLRNGGEFAVDNFTFVNQADLAPTMVGAQLDTDGSTAYYVTNVDLPAYVSMNCVTTHMIAKYFIDEKYTDRAYDFDFKLKEAGFASMRADEESRVLLGQDGKVMRSGNFYTTYEGFANMNPTARVLARTEITLSDNYGNSLGIVLGTNNTDADKAIDKGVYSRSLTQMKRLTAKALIEGDYADLAAEMITPVAGKALWNCNIDEVWAFVLEADKRSKQ